MPVQLNLYESYFKHITRTGNPRRLLGSDKLKLLGRSFELVSLVVQAYWLVLSRVDPRVYIVR